MPQKLTVVAVVEILQHAVSMGYDWNTINALESYRELYPEDGASFSYIENEEYGEDENGNPTTWLDEMEDPIMKKIMTSFMEKHDLMDKEWALSN